MMMPRKMVLNNSQLAKRFAKVCKQPSSDVVTPDISQARGKRHLGKLAPFIGSAPANMVKIVQVVHVAIGLYLKGIQIIGGISRPAEIAQGKQRVPSVKEIEQEPRIASVLSLSQMDHLMVLQRIEPGIQSIGCRLLACINAAEKRNGRISLPAQPLAHRGRHVHHSARPGRAEYGKQEVHALEIANKKTRLRSIALCVCSGLYSATSRVKQSYLFVVFFVVVAFLVLVVAFLVVVIVCTAGL